MSSELSEVDVKDYLVRVYFGPLNDGPVRKSVDRAYRDFNRTLRGFGVLHGGAEMRSAAKEYLADELGSLATAEMTNQPDFDDWHEATCNQLKSFYGDFRFTIGQSQKWINMAIKYLFVLDRSLVEDQWQYCHVPIDRILLQQLHEQGHLPPRIHDPWSGLDDYSQYLGFQQWFRDEFPGAPMDKEFDLWMR